MPPCERARTSAPFGGDLGVGFSTAGNGARCVHRHQQNRWSMEPRIAHGTVRRRTYGFFEPARQVPTGRGRWPVRNCVMWCRFLCLMSVENAYVVILTLVAGYELFSPKNIFITSPFERIIMSVRLEPLTSQQRATVPGDHDDVLLRLLLCNIQSTR